MKTISKNAFRLAVIMIVMLFTARTNASTLPVDPLLFSISIPESWQSSIVRQDFENQSIFSLKNGSDKPVFLFSVSKATGDQWQMIHNQLKNVTILENKDGYILYVERNTQTHIKGNADAQYQQILSQLNTILQSIHVQS